MKPTLKKVHWIDRARATAEFHKNLVRRSGIHTIHNTAKMLERSFSSVADDIMVDSWLETHPKLAECRYMNQAVKWIRNRKREIQVRGSVRTSYRDKQRERGEWGEAGYRERKVRLELERINRQVKDAISNRK